MKLACMMLAALLWPAFATAENVTETDLLQQSVGANHGKGQEMKTDPTEKVRGKFGKGRNDKLTPEEKAQLREDAKARGNWQKEYLDKLTQGDKKALKEFRDQMLERRRAKLATVPTPEERAQLRAKRKAAVTDAQAEVIAKHGKDGKLTPEGRQAVWQGLEARRAMLLKIAGKEPDGVIEPADRDPAKIRKNAKTFLLKKYHVTRKCDPDKPELPCDPEPGSPGYPEAVTFTAEEEAAIWKDLADGKVWQ